MCFLQKCTRLRFDGKLGSVLHELFFSLLGVLELSVECILSFNSRLTDNSVARVFRQGKWRYRGLTSATFPRTKSRTLVRFPQSS